MLENGEFRLIPQTKKKIETKTPGQNKLLILSSLFLVLIIGLTGGLVFYRRGVIKKLKAIDDELIAIEKSRDKATEEKLIKFKDEIAVTRELLTNHVNWSEAFSRIQSLILPQVQFDSLSVKLDKGEYVFKAFADSYATIARQIAAFYSDGTIVDVNVGKVSTLPGGRIEFFTQLNLDLSKTIKKGLSK